MARLVNITLRDPIRDGQLVAVLPDWEMQSPPPINLLYRPNFRRNPRVRPFVDFVMDHFSRLGEGIRGADLSSVPAAPAWYRSGVGRSSAAGVSSRGKTR